ncbi:MAG: 50S ribosomal protein L6, partial [Candidatus Aenigmarchaeota archaeon]|nr:50S ribosomal protein L6 [Candidatus Aenigmarchaeota archaeon]
MEKIVKIPDGITVSIDKWKVSIKGKQGTLERSFYSSLFSKKVSIK